MALNCYKNVQQSVWEFYDDETDTMDTIPFGGIVAGYVAHVLNMGDNGDLNLIYDTEKDDLFQTESLNKVPFKIGLEGYQIKDIYTDTALYKAQDRRLMSTILSVSGKNKPDTELYQIAEEFKWFGFNIVRNLPYDLSHDREKKAAHSNIEYFYNEDKDVENANVLIQYIGVRCLNGSHCQLFRVDDFSVAFGLDLHAYLFENTNTSHSIKFCSYCNRFFFAGKGNIKMCSTCRSKKEIERALRNEHSRNDLLYKKVRQVRNYLNSLKGNEKFDNKIIEFDNQLFYYIDKLNQKEINREDIHDKYDEELPVVSSKDDILRWCEKYHQNVKKEYAEWRKN